MVSAGEAQQAKGPSKLPLPKADPAPKRIVTQGLGKTTIEDLVPCAVNQPGMNIRKNPVGEVVAQDGTRFTAPVPNNFQTAPKLPDLYNECNKVTPRNALGSRFEQAAHRRHRQATATSSPASWSRTIISSSTSTAS